MYPLAATDQHTPKYWSIAGKISPSPPLPTGDGPARRYARLLFVSAAWRDYTAPKNFSRLSYLCLKNRLFLHFRMIHRRDSGVKILIFPPWDICNLIYLRIRCKSRRLSIGYSIIRPANIHREYFFFTFCLREPYLKGLSKSYFCSSISLSAERNSARMQFCSTLHCTATPFWNIRTQLNLIEYGA
jgi:hypothetical protein